MCAPSLRWDVFLLLGFLDLLFRPNFHLIFIKKLFSSFRLSRKNKKKTKNFFQLSEYMAYSSVNVFCSSLIFLLQFGLVRALLVWLYANSSKLFYTTCVSGRHSRNLVSHRFFAPHLTPRPLRVLKFVHMIDLAYISHMQEFHPPTRSGSKTWRKKTVIRKSLTSAVPVIGHNHQRWYQGQLF